MSVRIAICISNNGHKGNGNDRDYVDDEKRKQYYQQSNNDSKSDSIMTITTTMLVVMPIKDSNTSVTSK